MNFGKGLTGLRIDFYTDFLLTGNIKETVAGSVTVSSFCIKLYTPPSSKIDSGWERINIIHDKIIIHLFFSSHIKSICIKIFSLS